MEIEKLFNELSSRYRFEILEMLKDEEKRFSDIVNRIGLSSPEISRHLKRLQETYLVEKLPDGGYRLSFLGKTIMRMTSHLPILVEKAGYFAEHDASVIPINLLRNFEPVAESKIEPVFSMIGKLINSLSTSEFYWDITNQMSGSEPEIIDPSRRDNLEEIEFRFIVTPNVIPRISKILNEYDLNIQMRLLENINFTVNVSKELAFFALPGRNGTIDRNAFILGDSPKFIEWCKSFYLHYWNKAKPY